MSETMETGGNVLLRLRRFEEAVASYGQMLAIKPDPAEVLNNRVAHGEAERITEGEAGESAPLGAALTASSLITNVRSSYLRRKGASS